jgi:hypothetical protein
VNGGIIEVKVPLSTLGNPTVFDNISADVNDCCVPSPVVLDDVTCVALEESQSVNSAILSIARLDDFLFPAAEFGVEFELELDVAGITEVTVTVGGTPFDLEEWDGFWENSDDMVFADLASMKTALDGEWTIEIIGSSPSTSSFTVDAASLTDGDFFPAVTNLSPANGAVGVDSGTNLSWTDPTGPSTPFVLGAWVDTDFGGDQEVINLEGGIAVDATAWQPAELLQDGLNEFGVFYADVDASFITPISVSSGSISWSSPDFSPSGYPTDRPLLALGSESIVSFTVPEPSSALVWPAALGTLALLARRRVRRA